MTTPTKLNPLALPMALLGVRSLDAEAFCVGVTLVAETIKPGAPYGERYNDMLRAPQLVTLSDRITAEIWDKGMPTSLDDWRRVTHEAVMAAALRHVVIADINRRSMHQVVMNETRSAWFAANVRSALHRLNMMENDHA